MKLQVAACTDTGAVRSNNEDAFSYCTEQGIFVVCDGMGGAAAGEVASHMAADCMVDMLCGDPPAKKRAAIEKAVAEANRRVFVRSQREAGLIGMGTTLVMAVVDEGSATLVHIGDSRCYLLRNGQLQRCTQDHSLVDEQLRLGQITEHEAEVSPYRNIITRAIGTHPTVEPEFREVRISEGDLLLLCSDGLTREVSEEQIAQIAGLAQPAGDLDSVCQALVDAAKASGGRDNITCVLVRV